MSPVTRAGGIVPAGTISDTELVSPNNAVYRDVVGRVVSNLADTNGANTYVFSTPGNISVSTANTGPMGVFYLDPADYTVAGLTTKLRVRGTWTTNTVAPAITCTFGLYPVATSGGGADANTQTLGTVETGSTAAIASPLASTLNTLASADFTHPAAGYFALAIATSGTPTADARGHISAVLQMRHV